MSIRLVFERDHGIEELSEEAYIKFMTSTPFPTTEAYQEALNIAWFLDHLEHK